MAEQLRVHCPGRGSEFGSQHPKAPVTPASGDPAAPPGLQPRGIQRHLLATLGTCTHMHIPMYTNNLKFFKMFLKLKKQKLLYC